MSRSVLKPIGESTRRRPSRARGRRSHGEAQAPILARVDARTASAVVGVLVCLTWSYWSTITELVVFWFRNEDYSIGMLVLPVAAYLIWRRREELAKVPIRPCLAGFGVLAFAEAVRLLGLYFGIGSGDRYALVICIAGLTLLFVGPAMTRRLAWVLVFLLLMVPLPARIHEAIALPLQDAATSATVFGLETFGFFVVREGNVLRLDEQTTVAVTEACSGLRMMTAFVFIAAVLAFVVERPRWQRATLLALSIPVAVASNGLRGFVTAALTHYSGSTVVRQGIHDIAGWAMMPLALAMSIGLLKLMDVLWRSQREATA